MRINVKLVLDIDPHAAWRAVHSPAAFSELYGPLFTMSSMQGDLPTTWEPGSDVPVRLSLAGSVPLGAQLIHVSDRYTEDARGNVRILRDSGVPLTGPLATLRVWDHQMAIAPAPEDVSKTLWRERLVIAGPTAPLLWPALWSIWQWRTARLKALAPTWAHDLPVSDEAPDGTVQP